MRIGPFRFAADDGKVRAQGYGRTDHLRCDHGRMSAPLAHPDLEWLYELWRAKRGSRVLPRRADLDALEIPVRLWPHIMVVAVIREGNGVRFRYRRAGGAFVVAFGRDPSGGYLDDTLPVRGGYRDYVIGLYTRVVARRHPSYSENTFTLAGQATPRLARRLILPLSNDGDAVDTLFTAHFFELPRAGQTLAEPESFLAGCEIDLQ